MTYSQRENSRSRGQPVNLYFFKYGEGDEAYYAYTDCEQEIIFDDIPYTPIPIKRGALTSSGTLDKSTLAINVPQNIALTELYRLYPPSQVVTLIIREGHVNDPDQEFLVTWSGRVLGTKREDNEAVLSCEPISSSLKQPGLRRNYQHGCPHALYGTQCRANKEAATSTFVVQTVNDARVQLPDDWASEDLQEKYRGGLITWLSAGGVREIRTILRIIGGNTLLLTGPASGLIAGMYVDVSLGCNRLMDDCETLHNNILNFGGQWLIPTDNPIGVKNNFY